MDLANSTINTSLPILQDGTIAKIPKTGTGPKHTLDRLSCIDCYMDNSTTAVQGGTNIQGQVFDGTIQYFTWISTHFTNTEKELVRTKVLLEEEGDWVYVKEVLGRTVEIESGKVALPEKNCPDLLNLLGLIPTQIFIV